LVFILSKFLDEKMRAINFNKNIKRQKDEK